MPKNAKYNCKYCAGKTCCVDHICSNCKEKLEVVKRIKSLLATLQKAEKSIFKKEKKL